MARLELAVSGMTCTNCSSRVERKLNRVDGVEATVSFASETAEITYNDASVSPEELVDVIRATGYDASPIEEAPEAEDLSTRLWFSIIVTIPLTAVSMIPAWQFPYWQWVALLLATPVYLYAGWPFHRATIINLRHGSFTMDTLVSIGTTAAWGWSVYSLIFGGAGDPGLRMSFSFTGHAHPIYFEVTAVVITFLLLGRHLEQRAKHHSSTALRELLSLGAKTATLTTGEEIPTGQLRTGDRIIVRPGERIAGDGVVIDGASAVDQSMMTGESLPVDVAEGGSVTGGTVNTNGRLVVEITRTGEDTTLAQLQQLMRNAQSGQSPVQRLADRIAQYFVPAVLIIAAVTLVLHLALGSPSAISAAVAVLVIACPCALGLATPMALLAATGRGAAEGFVIKGPEILESTKNIDTIVLDKTGTITTGIMRVDPGADPELLALAASVEEGSEHPIGRAIVAAAPEHPKATDFVSTPGWGVTATVEGRRVSVHRSENAAVTITVNGEVDVSLTLSDPVKETSKAAIAKLHELGLKTVLLTGDQEKTAKAVACEVGIDEVIAEVMPAEKVNAVTLLQEHGSVAMVGDGVNDAAALAQADLGVAMASGSDFAIEASDITLMTNDLRSAAQAIVLSRQTLRIIRQNLFWAFAYNTALIPVAACGLLNPMFSGIAMAASSLLVVGNSLRLR